MFFMPFKIRNCSPLVIISSVTVLMLLSGGLFAQNASNRSQVSLRFSVYPIGSADWDQVYYQQSPGNYEKVTFWTLERSPEHRFRGALPVRFYHQSTDDEGQIFYQPIATAKIDRQQEQLLFFFIPKSSPSETGELFDIAILDDSIRSFPLNTITFLNATGANLEGIFGKQKIILGKGISTPYQLEDLYEDEVLIGLAIQYEGDYRKVLQNRWVFYPDNREIVVLLPPRNRNSFRIQAYRLSQHQESLHRTAGREREDQDESEENFDFNE